MHCLKHVWPLRSEVMNALDRKNLDKDDPYIQRAVRYELTIYLLHSLIVQKSQVLYIDMKRRQFKSTRWLLEHATGCKHANSFFHDTPAHAIPLAEKSFCQWGYASGQYWLSQPLPKWWGQHRKIKEIDQSVLAVQRKTSYCQKMVIRQRLHGFTYVIGFSLQTQYASFAVLGSCRTAARASGNNQLNVS